VPGLGQGAEPPARENVRGLIAYGSLLSDDGTARLGTAALPTAPAVPVPVPVHYAAIEVHDWTAGGRRQGPPTCIEVHDWTAGGRRQGPPTCTVDGKVSGWPGSS
jgi:hypothetical protein